MLNRNEAIEWCVRSFSNWPTPYATSSPHGWAWFELKGRAALQPNVKSSIDPITKFEWINALPPAVSVDPLAQCVTVSVNVGGNQKMSRDDALEWCIATYRTDWVTNKDDFAPNGWTWEGDSEGLYLNPSEPLVITITERCWDEVRNAQCQPAVQGRELFTLNQAGTEWHGDNGTVLPAQQPSPASPYGDWKTGDDCWLNNEKGLGIPGGLDELLGFHIKHVIRALFTSPNGVTFAVTCVDNDGQYVWRLDMLQRPIVKCDFEHGKNVFITAINTCVGRYVGTNPDTNDVVTVVDGKFKSYQLNQVTQ